MGGLGRMVMAALAATAGSLSATPAQAYFEICNQTKGDVTVAFGYRENGVWTSKGWWNIEPSGCATVYGDKLRERYYYYYAEEIDSDGIWGGDYRFCALDDAFTIQGDENCKSRGYDAYDFRQVDVGEEFDYSIDLTY